MKYYALIDTYSREIQLFDTKPKLIVGYRFCKTMDHRLPFINGIHYRAATVNVPYMPHITIGKEG